ncbi:hypothetical protein [Burkholderia sp. WSM2230]|uniref:hypothetical protein n=1 Tax=Burkholderia sp. WSM2230 TaxID=944435 RepID=UPI00046F5C07|nr:hypothetical protein [Burkholderia sp. WSM2230]
MVDFIKSLHVGLDAAKTAEQNRAEIDAIFEELNRQLSQATDGKVRLKRAEFNQGLQFTATFQRVTYWALAVFSTIEGIQPTEIAKWHMDRSGYPCTIDTESSSKWHCQDKEGLERALGLLLQDPLVGEIIQKYIRMTPPSPTEAT